MALQDAGDAPPERLLQAVWHHQRVRRGELQTADGRPVRVLHPGFPNPEGGPDFRDAFLAVGDAAPRRGDVEVDVRALNWRAHGHDRNPRFRNVILHVVWETNRPRPVALAQPAGRPDPTPDAASPPVLSLRDVLDAPLAELALWLNGPAAAAWPEQLRGRCWEALRQLSAERLAELLRQAALVRLQSKGAQLRARARLAGWEQALWEGLFRALGYKHNVWAMQWLAERRAQWQQEGLPVLELQARLFGLSGLLPTDVARGGTGDARYVRRLWDVWWRQREALVDCCLPRTAWRLQGLRPANHPQRRLALAAHWLAAGNLTAQLEAWGLSAHPPAGAVAALHALLQPGPDEFWSWHWTFRSARLSQPEALLGRSRTTDLALNVVLPWLWQRASDGQNDTLRVALEERYLAWPAAQDNAVLRLARQRLLGGGPALRLGQAALQQGLLQIVRDFCDHANALCDGCPFPGLVQGWQGEPSPPLTSRAG